MSGRCLRFNVGMKKHLKLFLFVASVVIFFQGQAIASLAAPLTGTWKSVDQILGEFTLIIKEMPYDTVHGTLIQAGGKTVDLGDADVRDIQSPFAVGCGILRERIADFKLKNLPRAEFRIQRVKCPDGSDYDPTHVMVLWYDTIFSDLGSKTKDVMSAFNLVRIHD